MATSHLAPLLARSVLLASLPCSDSYCALTLVEEVKERPWGHLLDYAGYIDRLSVEAEKGGIQNVELDEAGT